MRLHETSIQAVADGGDMDDAHREARIRFSEAALNEGRGEGYHRGMSHEHSRAPSSSDKHLKQSTRQKSAFAFVQDFLRRWGDRADEVVRFEWINYKRILRPPGDKRWVPVPMSTQKFYGRVYREDSMAEISWTSIA